jgi:hypothetical protein
LSGGISCLSLSSEEGIVKAWLYVSRQFKKYIDSFSDGFCIELCNSGGGGTFKTTGVAIRKVKWEGIAKGIIDVIMFSLGGGSGGKFGFLFPILVFHADKVPKCFLFLESSISRSG